MKSQKYGVCCWIHEDNKKDRTKRILEMYRWFVNTLHTHPELILTKNPMLTKTKEVADEGEVKYILKWEAS